MAGLDRKGLSEGLIGKVGLLAGAMQGGTPDQVRGGSRIKSGIGPTILGPLATDGRLRPLTVASAQRWPELSHVAAAAKPRRSMSRCRVRVRSSVWAPSSRSGGCEVWGSLAIDEPQSEIETLFLGTIKSHSLRRACDRKLEK